MMTFTHRMKGEAKGFKASEVIIPLLRPRVVHWLGDSQIVRISMYKQNPAGESAIFID